MWTYLEASYTCMKGRPKLYTCTLAHMLNKWCQSRQSRRVKVQCAATWQLMA